MVAIAKVKLDIVKAVRQLLILAWELKDKFEGEPATTIELRIVSKLGWPKASNSSFITNEDLAQDSFN